MMLGSRSIGRLAAIFVTVLLIQITVVPHFRLNGYVIDLPLVVTLLICLYLSPANAAVMGFVCGLIFDLVLHTPFGQSLSSLHTHFLPAHLSVAQSMFFVQASPISAAPGDLHTSFEQYLLPLQ